MLVEDKTLELLTKMYGEFTSRFDKIETDMQGLDGYKLTYEKLDVIEQKLDNLAEKVDRHDIKIKAIEGGRK